MKNFKDVLSDNQLLLKLLEIVLAIIGIILMQYVYLFYDRWVYEMLVVGLGGYLLICTAAFISSIQDNAMAPMTDTILMLVGAVLNILAGIMTIVEYSNRNGYYSGVVITYALNTNTKNMDLGLGIVDLLLGIVMFGDFILGVLN